MKIDKYFDSIKDHKAQVAEVKRWMLALDVCHATVYGWRAGRKNPSTNNARRIQAITNGAVTAQEILFL